MSWKFFVRNVADGERQKADWKSRFDPDTGEPGVFYPRAGALGACTAHNAMIFFAPDDSDWDEIARITGDAPGARRTCAAIFACSKTAAGAASAPRILESAANRV